jgi:hypothetical protein
VLNGEWNFAPVPLAVSDAVLAVAAQSNTALYDTMEGAEGQESEEHCMYSLQFGAVGGSPRHIPHPMWVLSQT